MTISKTTNSRAYEVHSWNVSRLEEPESRDHLTLIACEPVEQFAARTLAFSVLLLRLQVSQGLSGSVPAPLPTQPSSHRQVLQGIMRP